MVTIIILNFFKANFENKLFIWISDRLHLFKKGRSKIINNKIGINSEIAGNFVNSEKLNEILDLGPPLLDKSSIGKLRDFYPVCIFTLNNSIKTLLNGDLDTFFYIFVYSLWNEYLLNKNLSPQTRSDLLQILLEILLIIYDKYTKLNLPENVGFKKSANKEYVTMFSIQKLQRMIPTVMMTFLEIVQENPMFKKAIEDWIKDQVHIPTDFYKLNRNQSKQRTLLLGCKSNPLT